MVIPMQLDQPFNARVVEEARIGVEVKRDKVGRLDRDEISRLVRCVVSEEDGGSVRRKASEGITSRGRFRDRRGHRRTDSGFAGYEMRAEEGFKRWNLG